MRSSEVSQLMRKGTPSIRAREEPVLMVVWFRFGKHQILLITKFFPHLRQYPFNHLGWLHAAEPLVEPVMVINQLFMIETQ
jgi:hypothetical protein